MSLEKHRRILLFCCSQRIGNHSLCPRTRSVGESHSPRASDDNTVKAELHLFQFACGLPHNLFVVLSLRKLCTQPAALAWGTKDTGSRLQGTVKMMWPHCLWQTTGNSGCLNFCHSSQAGPRSGYWSTQFHSFCSSKGSHSGSQSLSSQGLLSPLWSRDPGTGPSSLALLTTSLFRQTILVSVVILCSAKGPMRQHFQGKEVSEAQSWFWWMHVHCFLASYL